MEKKIKIIVGSLSLIFIIVVAFAVFNYFKPAWVFARVVEEEPQNYVEITQRHIDRFPNLIDLFNEADLPATGVDAMIRLDNKGGRELIESLGEGFIEHDYYHQYVKYNDKYYLVWVIFQYETPLRL